MATAASREMGLTTSIRSMDVNGAMRVEYRGRRCPRWRLRDGSGRPRVERGAGGSRSTRRTKTLLMDAEGGEPFEKMKETEDGISVWMRASDDANCAAKEVMAVATFHDCTARQFWRAVRDVERYAEFVPFVETSFAVERTSGSAVAVAMTDARACDVVWAYNRVKIPVASARDYCIKIVSSRNGAPPGSAPPFPLFRTSAVSDVGGSVQDESFVSRWEIDGRAGPKTARGVVRLRVNRGSWRVADDARGGCTVTYRVLTDPGAGTPGWLIDVANKSSVPDVLRAFNRRARSGVYEAEDEASARADVEAAADVGKNTKSPRFFWV